MDFSILCFRVLRVSGLLAVLFTTQLINAQEYCYNVTATTTAFQPPQALNSAPSGVYGNPQDAFVQVVSSTLLQFESYTRCSDVRPYEYCYELGNNTINKVQVDIEPKQCPTSYSLFEDTDGVYRCQSVQLCGGEDQICADGLPANAGVSLGYGVTCDRPALKQCDNGSYVPAYDVCPAQCHSESSCYAYAYNTTGCAQGDDIVFDYTDPSNWSITCTSGNTGGSTGGGVSEGNSPDYTPQFTQLSGDISDMNTAVNQSLTSLEGANSTGFANVQSGIAGLSTDIQSQTLDLTTSIDNQTSELGGKLDDIKGAIEGLNLGGDTGGGDTGGGDTGTGGGVTVEPFDANEIYNTAPASSMPAHTVTTYTTFEEVNTAFMQRVENVPLFQSITAYQTQFTGAGTCPTLETHLFNETQNTTIMCDVLEQNRTVFAAIFALAYVLFGIRIILSA